MIVSALFFVLWRLNFPFLLVGLGLNENGKLLNALLVHLCDDYKEILIAEAITDVGIGFEHFNRNIYIENKKNPIYLFVRMEYN